MNSHLQPIANDRKAVEWIIFFTGLFWGMLFSLSIYVIFYGVPI